MTEERKNRLKRQILEARAALIEQHGEFALPLLEMFYVATKEVKRISTNGVCIYFDADWLQKLGTVELQFILSHQLMHIALKHVERSKYYSGDRFHLACDIVANSHLKQLGWAQEKLPHIGNIYTETFFPKIEGRELTAQEALRAVPFDPANLKAAARRKYMIDSEEWWERKNDRGENGVIVLQPGEDEPVLRSKIGACAPERLLVPKYQEMEIPLLMDVQSIDSEAEATKKSSTSWDIEASEAVRSLREQKQRQEATGMREEFRERIWSKSAQPSLNWRQLLNRFVQAELCDYSFAPPDKRLQDSEFFLPDYNVQTEAPKEVWFMVDTSASISDETLSAVYSELCGALAQFSGALKGYLGFFDMRVYQPKPFADVADLAAICPLGGSGTDFHCVFDYFASRNENPESLVIFTDGQGEFPQEASELPVLWLFTSRNAAAPWGNAAFVG